MVVVVELLKANRWIARMFCRNKFSRWYLTIWRGAHIAIRLTMQRIQKNFVVAYLWIYSKMQPLFKRLPHCFFAGGNFQNCVPNIKASSNFIHLSYFLQQWMKTYSWWQWNSKWYQQAVTTGCINRLTWEPPTKTLTENDSCRADIIEPWTFEIVSVNLVDGFYGY